MQMTVCPAHGDLNDGVHPAEVGRLGHDHGASYGGVGPFQLDAQDAEVTVSTSSPAGAGQVHVDHVGKVNPASAAKAMHRRSVER